MKKKEQNKMLNRLLTACYDRFIEKGDLEIAELREKITKKILQNPKPDEIFVSDLLSDLSLRCEDRAYRQGFENAVEAIASLTGR